MINKIKEFQIKALDLAELTDGLMPTTASRVNDNGEPVHIIYYKNKKVYHSLKPFKYIQEAETCLLLINVYLSKITQTPIKDKLYTIEDDGFDLPDTLPGDYIPEDFKGRTDREKTEWMIAEIEITLDELRNRKGNLIDKLKMWWFLYKYKALVKWAYHYLLKAKFYLELEVERLKREE